MREARRPTTCSLASTSLSCRPAVSMPCRSAEACCRGHGLIAGKKSSLLALSSFLDIPLPHWQLSCVQEPWSKLGRSNFASAAQNGDPGLIMDTLNDIVKTFRREYGKTDRKLKVCARPAHACSAT